MPYIETYCEALLIKRRVFTDYELAKKHIERYIDYSNVSISPWIYNRIDEKKTFDDKFIRYGPVYESAVVDKIFLDFDCYDRNGNFNNKVYNSFLKTYKYLTKKDIKRFVTFTGGGYQMLIYTEDIQPSTYVSVVNSLISKLGIIVDKNISLANLMRYPSSFNFKKTRRVYCISLTHNEIVSKTFQEHKQLAKERRTELYYYGSNLYKPDKQYNIQNQIIKLERKSSNSVHSSVDDILAPYGYSYEELCPRMRDIIEQEHVGHFERIIIIEYLKDIVGLSYGDVLLILPKIMTGDHGSMNDGEHSIMEGQPKVVYSKNFHFSPDKYYKLGYCTCTDCNKIIALSKELLYNDNY